MPVTIQPIASPNPVGYYTSMDRMGKLIGLPNVVQWTNLEQADQAGNIDTIQDILNRVDNWINRQFREAGYNTPIPVGIVDFGIICDYATEYACVLAYMTKPETLTDEGQDMAGRMRAHQQHAEEGINNLVTMGIEAPRTFQQTQGISIIPLCPDRSRYVWLP